MSVAGVGSTTIVVALPTGVGSVGDGGSDQLEVDTRAGCVWHAISMIEPAVPVPGGNLRRLTSLRAFAALAVFGIHAGSAFGWPLWQRLFGLGYAGVGFFFVLSGFVLTWATRPTTRPQVFWWRRFARIYPAYIGVGVIAGVVYGFGSTYSTAAYVLGERQCGRAYLT